MATYFQKAPENSRTYSDSRLKELRRNLTPIEVHLLKTLHADFSFGIWNKTLLENAVLKKDTAFKGVEIRKAIADLERMKLVKVTEKEQLVSLTLNAYYLILLTDLKRSSA